MVYRMVILNLLLFCAKTPGYGNAMRVFSAVNII